MSSLKRMLSILELFSQDRPTWTAEEIAQQLDCSIPTAYRYVRELSDARLLRSTATGQYGLGTKIIELDYQLRIGDPLILAGTGPMKKLARQLDCDVALVALSGTHLLTIHYESNRSNIRASYGRGRRMPTFKGALSLALLSALNKPLLRKLYQANSAEAQYESDLPAYENLVERLRPIRKQKYATSAGVLDPHNAGIAIPLLTPESDITASLGLILSVERFRLLEADKAAGWLLQCAAEIRLHLQTRSVAPPSPCIEDKLATKQTGQ